MRCYLESSEDSEPTSSDVDFVIPDERDEDGTADDSEPSQAAAESGGLEGMKTPPSRQPSLDEVFRDVEAEKHERRKAEAGLGPRGRIRARSPRSPWRQLRMPDLDAPREGSCGCHGASFFDGLAEETRFIVDRLVKLEALVGVLQENCRTACRGGGAVLGSPINIGGDCVVSASLVEETELEKSDDDIPIGRRRRRKRVRLSE